MEQLPLFTRLIVFFLLSPAFSKFPLSTYAKGAWLCGLTLFGTYNAPISFTSFAIEGAIGYLMGTLFALIVESIEVTARLVTTLAGISFNDIFSNPSSEEPLTSPLVMAAVVLFFLSDFHHDLSRLLLMPIKLSSIYDLTLFGLTNTFTQGLLFSCTPLIMLSILALFIFTIAKLFPGFPFFWTFLPLQIIIGFFAYLALFTRLPLHLKQLLAPFMTLC